MFPLPKQVQIEFDLFCELLTYFHDHQDEHESGSDFDEIYRKLSNKADKIINRELFTRYKRAATPEERERYRKQYLEKRGISQDFRTDREVKSEDL